MGLSGTGSPECPDQLRKELVEMIARYQKLYGDKTSAPIGAELLNSRNTAVVKVMGNLPPGCTKGDTFDLAVAALANTGTTSLEGGRLYSCDMRVYSGPTGQDFSSNIKAQAAGRIFINPFEKKTFKGANVLHRNGFVLDGGTCLEDRKIELVLYQPSYPTARAIEQKINSIFGPPPDDPLWQTAKASSSDRIELNIPRKYRSDLQHFIGLIQNIFIRKRS